MSKDITIQEGSDGPEKACKYTLAAGLRTGTCDDGHVTIAMVMPDGSLVGMCLTAEGAEVLAGRLVAKASLVRNRANRDLN